MAKIIRREWTSREMMKLEWRVKTYGPDSRSGEGANRQRVILIVHLRLNADLKFVFARVANREVGAELGLKPADVSHSRRCAKQIEVAS